jgi:hypothetical protein
MLQNQRVAAAPVLTMPVYILFILLLVGTVIVVSIASLVLPRKPPSPDPRIALLAQCEGGLMAHIRDRYKCTDEATRQIRHRFLEWEVDAADTGVVIGEDGKLFLSDCAVDVIDGYAIEIGLRPAAKTEGHI